LRLETPALVRIDGEIRLNGGNGGDSKGSSTYNDGSCDADCLPTQGCANGICQPKGGGSFGGSGGGGSGGALIVRSNGLRADGLLQAIGGETGELSQGGGCQADPAAEIPIPGQGRGGRGAPGRLRIETQTPTGSVQVANGSFSRGELALDYGLEALSTWYPLNGPDSVLQSAIAVGLGSTDQLLLQTATSEDPADASEWHTDPSQLPPGSLVRFRVVFSVPIPGKELTVIELLKFDYGVPLT
jgi:hypothetical protein